MTEPIAGIENMLEIVESAKGQDQGCRRNAQGADGAHGVLPIGGGEEEKDRRHDGNDQKLKDVRGGAFVGQGLHEVSAEDGEQSADGKDDQGPAAEAVELVRTHEVTPFAMRTLSH